jgi:hypothetical protein
VSDLSFKVAARRRTPITFDLGGDDHVYTFLPPKQAGVFMPMLDAANDDAASMSAARAAFKWLDDGLGKEDQDHIEARLRDEDDDLDFDTLGEVINGLMEKVSGRPTS